MWSQPGANQTPKAFHGVDVYFVDTVSIRVAGVLALTVIDRDVNVAPSWETGINAVLVGIHDTSLLDHLCDPGSPKKTLSTTRDHPQDWGFVRRRCSSPPLPLAEAAGSVAERHLR